MYLVKNNKSSFYQLVYFADGKRTTISTRTTSESEAKKFLANFSPVKNIEKPVKEKVILLTSLRDEYFEHIKLSKSKSYLRSVQLSFSQFLSFTGNLPIKNIDSHLLDRFISNTFSRSNSAASLYYRTLKAAFSKAESWGYIPSNPFKKLKPPKVSKSYPAFIDYNELQLIISNTPKPFLIPLFYTAFYTGMRLAELVNMKWNWIDFPKNIITIKCDTSFTTKSRKERIIPINSTLRNILLNHQPKVINISKDEFVFTSANGFKLNEDFVSKNFKKAVKQAGVNTMVHFHSLRHSFCSNLVQKGVSLYIVKDLAGHQNISTTQNYAHLVPENLHQAVNLL